MVTGMLVRSLALLLLLLLLNVSISWCQTPIRATTGASLDSTAAPGTVFENSRNFSDPTGSIQGSITARVERTSEKLRSAVLSSDVSDASTILTESDEIDELALGFQFDSVIRNVTLNKSEDRSQDPDVVAIKAIATSAVESTDAEKLAIVMAESTGEVNGLLVLELMELLEDTSLMRAIISADPLTEFVPHEDYESVEVTSVPEFEQEPEPESESTLLAESEFGDGLSKSSRKHRATVSSTTRATPKIKTSTSTVHSKPTPEVNALRRFTITDIGDFGTITTSTGKRKLLCDGCTPVNSWVCAHCWPKNVCSKFAWCKTSGSKKKKSKKNKRRSNRG